MRSFFSTALPLLICACTNAHSTHGGSAGQGGAQTVELGKVLSGGVPAPAQPGVNVSSIKVNTVGYPIGWAKLAIVNVEPESVQIKNAQGDVVHVIPADRIRSFGRDPASDDPVWQVDFSDFRQPGTYTMTVGSAESEAFEIRDGVYREALDASLKNFYFQRTRTALVEPYAKWKKDSYTRSQPSHVHEDVGWDLEYYPEKKFRWEVDAGWHDAGNYDMYVPSTAPTAQALLMAYEWNPKHFDDERLNIPESGNDIPDILDEARWGLRWILSVQETQGEHRGAFRHREAVMKWSPEGPADQDRSERWIAGVSSSATAKATAALAYAARVYRQWDSDFAQRCAKAAQLGWKFLSSHPEHIRAEKKGSSQPLWDDEPEFNDRGARFIAATQMWLTFRDSRALRVATQAMENPESQPTKLIKGAWANLSRWAIADLALDTKTPGKLRNEATKRILAATELLRDRVESKDGYRCASSLDEYYWAHNSNLLEKAHILLVASRLDSKSTWLREAARDQWHWILGRNPNGYSMVTRVGKGPERIYHMEWGKADPPPPGYLVGGPNAANMGFLAPDAPAKALLWDNPTALVGSGLPPHSMWHAAQEDLWEGGFAPSDNWDVGWWAVSEPDIYYNGNLVLVATAMQSN